MSQVEVGLDGKITGMIHTRLGIRSEVFERWIRMSIFLRDKRLVLFEWIFLIYN